MAHQAHTQRESAGLQAPTPTPTLGNQNYKNKIKKKLKKRVAGRVEFSGIN
jgi:hypothetical protein